MPKVRLDQLPLDRRTQAMGGQAIVNKREIDPNTLGEITQRHGSEREAIADTALGLISEGKTSYITSEQPIALSGDFTALFNLKWGNLAEDGSYPILTLRAGTADTHYYQLVLNKSAENLIFKIYSRDGDSTVTDDSSVLTANSSGGIAFKRTGNALTLELNGTDISNDLTDISGSAPTGPFFLDLLGTVQGLNSFADKPTISGTHPVLSNLRLDDTNISVASGDDTTRTAGDYNYHWKLDGTYEAGYIPADTGTNPLLAIPSAPVVQGSALRFSGTAGALVIRHTPDLDYYFETYVNNPNTGKFGFQVEGTRAIETTLRDTVLIDYGDLCKLTILTNGKVQFTMNGKSATTASAQFTATNATYAFKVFCGRDSNNLYVRCVIADTPQEGENTDGDNYMPFLDYNNIPNFFIGSESGSGSTKRFKGSLTKVAFYPSYYQADAGDSLAEFAFDLTSSLLVDKSPKNRTAEPMSHFTGESVDPTYSQGGLTDAPFHSVEAGVVLSASGPINYNSKLTRQISDDVTSSRLGHLTFLESEGTVHVLNREKSNARTLGVPKPSRLITQRSEGGGALSGAYSYGYRYISDLGTAGPTLRLDPLKTSESARVLLGTPADPSLSSLGDTYLVTRKDEKDFGNVTEAAAGTLAAGTSWPLELYARSGESTETTDWKELIWHRGANMHDGGGWRSSSNAVAFESKENWTMQVAFKYSKSWTSNFTAIAGIGPNGNYWPQKSNRDSYRLPDFCAYIDHGEYGGSGGRLVVYAATRDKLSDTGDGMWGFIGTTDFSRYMNIGRFTNDAGYWEEGKNYNLVFIKSGDKLTVHCNKYGMYGYDDGSTELNSQWVTLTSASASGGITHTDDLFSGNVGRTATGFGVGQIPRVGAPAARITSSGALGLVTTNGWLNGGSGMGQIREWGKSGSANCYAFRVWTTAKSLGDFTSYGEDRFGCIADPEVGKLNHKLLFDLFPQTSDDEATSRTAEAYVTPGQLGVSFVFKIGNNDYTYSNYYRQPQNHAGYILDPKVSALCSIGHVVSGPGSLDKVSGKIYLSDIGNGSLVIAVGTEDSRASLGHEGRWRIMNRLWRDEASDNTVSRESLPFVNDWDEFNWISTLLRLGTSSEGGDVRTITLEGLVVNGNQIFTGSIGGGDTAYGRINDQSTGYIHLGNWGSSLASTARDQKDTEVHVGEFRMWTTDKGPDPTLGTNYDYLLGRVGSDQYANMRHYYKFQPADFNDATPDTIDDYGSTSRALALKDGATLNRLPGAAITDVGFPDSTHETIAAIEIFRTAGVPINDYEAEEEVQTALDTARTVQQFFLARIPIGTTQFVDSAPDSALGEEASYTAGYVPEGIISAFVWDNRLVLVDENNKMWPSEPGPLNWESFPNSVAIPNLSTQVTAAINVQGERNQAMVCLLGKSSGTLLTGSPDAPTSHVLGGGVGAENQQCLTHFNGIAFAYNGKLWAIQQGQAVDFGGPVQELLPTPANARVATSAKLSSLFVIDTNDGTCLRYHFPTKQWTVEERYATAVGDTEDGEDAWISKYGSWSKGSTAVYGDDVQDDTGSSNTNTINTTTKIFTTSSDLSSTLHVGMPVSIVDTASTPNVVSTHITKVDGAALTVASVSGLTAGSSTTATIYFGAGATGLLLDTGPMDVGDDSVISPKLLVDNLTGTGWEYAVHATKHPGDRDVLPALTYTSMSSASGYRASGVRGRFQRVVIRNRKREAAHIPLLEIDLS